MLALNQVTRRLVLHRVSVSHSMNWGACRVENQHFSCVPRVCFCRYSCCCCWLPVALESLHWWMGTGSQDSPGSCPGSGVGPLFKALSCAHLMLGKWWHSVHMPGTHQALAECCCPDGCGFVLVASVSRDSMGSRSASCIERSLPVFMVGWRVAPLSLTEFITQQWSVGHFWCVTGWSRK